MSEQAIHLVVTIVDRGKQDHVLSVCNENHAPVSMISLGHGTARTEILDMLGIGETQKNVILSPVTESAVPLLLERMASRLKMRYPGNGIAFAIPVSSISGRIYRALTHNELSEEERSKTDMTSQGNYELVVALINRGHANLVMEAARQVGAPGGTVLNTRGISAKQMEQFLGISIQSEKELVFLVVPAEKRLDVMQTISQVAGSKTPAQALVLSLPVSHAIGLA